MADPTDDKGASSAGPDETTKALQENVSMLTQAVGLLGKGLEEIRASQSQIADHLKPPPPPAPDPITPDSLLKDAGDLSQMDNAQIANLILAKATEIAEAKVKEVVSTSTKTIDDKVNSLAATVHSAHAREAADKLAAANPDFFEWTPEMRRIVADHPTISMQDAYTLAKSRDPEKVASMTKKYAKTPDATIISLAPGNKRLEGGGKMSPGDAALAAFDAVFAGTTGILNNDTKVA